jgi:hypothetical protein
MRTCGSTKHCLTPSSRHPRPAKWATYSITSPYCRRTCSRASSIRDRPILAELNATQPRGNDLDLIRRPQRLPPLAEVISAQRNSVVGNAQAIHRVLGPRRRPHENTSRLTSGHVAVTGHQLVIQVPPPMNLQSAESTLAMSSTRRLAIRRGKYPRKIRAAIAPTTARTICKVEITPMMFIGHDYCSQPRSM